MMNFILVFRLSKCLWWILFFFSERNCEGGIVMHSWISLSMLCKNKAPKFSVSLLVFRSILPFISDNHVSAKILRDRVNHSLVHFFPFFAQSLAGYFLWLALLIFDIVTIMTSGPVLKKSSTFCSRSTHSVRL